MRGYWLLFSVEWFWVCPPLGPIPAKDAPRNSLESALVKSHLEQIQGTWSLAKVATSDGQATFEELADPVNRAFSGHRGPVTFSVKGDAWVQQAGWGRDTERKLRLKVRPSEAPRTFNLSGPKGAEGQVEIDSLREGILTVSFRAGPGGQTRPVSGHEISLPGTVLLTFSREAVAGAMKRQERSPNVDLSKLSEIPVGDVNRVASFYKAKLQRELSVALMSLKIAKQSEIVASLAPWFGADEGQLSSFMVVVAEAHAGEVRRLNRTLEPIRFRTYQ